MALLEDGIEFTGRLGGFTAYRMKGCKRIVIRKRGGPSAEQIRKDPKYETARLNGREFGVRGQAMSVFVKMLQPHQVLADYNYSNAVSARLKVVQDLDAENKLGCRSILFSKDPGLWDGFALNREHGFDTLVPAPLLCTISRGTLSARIEIPELVPEVNLSLPASQSLFRLQATLGLVPDFVYDHSRARYVPSVLKERIAPELAVTPWMPCLNLSPASILELKLPEMPVATGFALMVSVGICFGKPVNGSQRVMQMKNVGAAKVLAVR